MLFINRRSDRLGGWLGRWFSKWFSPQIYGTDRFELNMVEKDRFEVTSHLEELAAVQRWFRTLISRLAVKTPRLNDQFDQLNLALAEGFTNAVRHAHADLPPATPIEIELVLQPQQVEICIFDQGEPFDPDSLSEPQPGTLREGGYGWFLLRRLADQVTYNQVTCNRTSVGLTDSATCTNSSGANPSGTVQRNCLRIVKMLRQNAMGDHA